MTTTDWHQSPWIIAILLLTALSLPACNLYKPVAPATSADTSTVTDTGSDVGEDGGSPEETGVDADGGDTNPGDTGGPDAETCVPKTCADKEQSCGQFDDGCGGTIDCGCDGNRVAKCQGVPCACSNDQTCELSYTAVLVKDVSRKFDPDLCIDDEQPGSDIFGARLEKPGSREFAGRLLGKSINARRFNDHRTLTGDILPASCPSQQETGEVMSLGCGGWVAFKFVDGDDDLTIHSGDEIAIGEWGNQCDDDCKNVQECGFDTYEVRLCTDAPTDISNGDISSCKVLAGGLGGQDKYKGRDIAIAEPPDAPLTQDTDEDGVPNRMDNCPSDANQDQKNQDNDPHGDACDNCPGDVNPSQTDSYGNGRGDECEGDCRPKHSTSCPQGKACRVVEDSERFDIVSCYPIGNTAIGDTCDGLLDKCPRKAQCLQIDESGERECFQFCDSDNDCQQGSSCNPLQDPDHGAVMVCQTDS